MKLEMTKKLPFYLAIAVLALSLLFAIAPGVLAANMIVIILALIGVAISIFSITKEERRDFLLVTIALTVASVAGISQLDGGFLEMFLHNLLIAMIPATIFLGLRWFWDMSSKK